MDRELVELLEAARTASDPGARPGRAKLLATLAVELTHAGDWPHRRDLAAEAVRMARALGEPGTLLDVLIRTYWAILVPETLDERLEITAEAVALADAQRDPALRYLSHDWRMRACGDAGDIDGIDVHLIAAAEAAAESGDPFQHWQVPFLRCWRALLAGDLVSAESLAEEALRRGTASGQPDALPVYVGQMLEIRRQQDRAAELEESIAAIVEAYPDVALGRAFLARLYCYIGREADARQVFRLDADTNFARVGCDYLWLWVLAIQAEVCVQLGDTDAAAVLYDLLAPWHAQFAMPNYTAAGSVALPLGMLATLLGRYDVAMEHFAEALTVHQRLEAPFGVAYTHLETARLLHHRRAAGDAERASGLFNEVGGIAESFGFRLLRRKVQQLDQAEL